MYTTYIINEAIVFDSVLGTICSKINADKIVHINTPTSRCFNLLIEKQGNVVPQRDILNYVWKEYGLEVSTNNFYQNISQLRKAIKEVGIEEDIIITIPKQGVLIPARVSIQRHSEDYHQNNQAENVDSDIIPGFIEKTEKTATKSNTSLLFRSLIITKQGRLKSISIILLIFSLYYFNLNKKDYSGRYLFYENNKNNCSLYFNSDVNNYTIHKEFIRNLNIDCDLKKDPSKYNNLYVTAYSGSKRISIFQCKYPMKENKLQNICISRYYN